MDEKAKRDMFLPMQSMLDSTLSTKKNSDKSRDQVMKFKGKFNIKFHISGESDLLETHLKVKDGVHKFALGSIDDYDIEIETTPEDLLYFNIGSLSIPRLLLGKNAAGQKMLKLKKGGRHAIQLLKLAKFIQAEK